MFGIKKLKNEIAELKMHMEMHDLLMMYGNTTGNVYAQENTYAKNNKERAENRIDKREWWMGNREKYGLEMKRLLENFNNLLERKKENV